MIILHVFSIDAGGAAIAAKRIAKAVEKNASEKIENRFLTLYPAKNDTQVTAYFNNSGALFLTRIMRKTCEVFLEPKTKAYPGPFSKGEFGIASRKKIQKYMSDVDIVHIHWTNRGLFSIRQLAQIMSVGKPVIWTMHDMWAFTGGCHYDGNCGKYKTECKNCHCVISGKTDFTKEQQMKQKIFSNQNVYFVGCSQWMTVCAQSSSVLKRQKNIQCIPNPIDETFLKGININERLKNRKVYGIPIDKKVVLFGAMSSDDDRKGGKLIQKILSKLPKAEFHVVVFGECEQKEEYEQNNTTFLGAISGAEKMHEIYALSDVFIAPSIQENLGNTVMESLASGTPVVAFDIGGMPDMIINDVNGKLVKAYQVDAFAEAIQETAVQEGMREKAINSVKNRFTPEKVGEQYYTLYCNALNNIGSSV